MDSAIIWKGQSGIDVSTLLDFFYTNPNKIFSQFNHCRVTSNNRYFFNLKHYEHLYIYYYSLALASVGYL